MRITIFPTVSAQSAESFDVTWAAFAERCKTPNIYPSKQACPLIKLATFGSLRTSKGALRHEDNMISVSGIEADYDAELMSPKAARDLLAAHGVRALIYTSPSHTPSAPRWRVLAPLSSDMPVAARRGFTGRLNTMLGGVLAPESFINAQSYYCGAVEGVKYEAYAVDGAPIDTYTHIEPTYPARVPSAPIASAHHPDRTATPETLTELRSALAVIPADDYETWTSVGIALSDLGEAGFALWSEWSATSTSYQGDTDLARWNTFVPDRTGFAAVFARAQRHGWVNPKASGAPVDTIAVFGAIQAATVISADIGYETLQPSVNQDIRLTSAEQQVKLFAGCVYVTNTRQMLIPDAPYIVDKMRFDEWAPVAGRSFIVNQTNSGAPEKSAWQAYLQSQILSWPRASGWCFRPECPPSSIIREEGETLVNLWQGFKVLRTPGDVTPFLTHLGKIFPVARDRAIVIAYLAGMVQYPGKKFQYCPVIQGAKGNGKSFIGACIEKALGAGYVHYPNSADITNKFTGWLQRKLCIIVEEISTHEKRETLEVLKPLITNTRIEMQSKGADQITGDNRANFIMFVNRQGSIPVDKDERRYSVFHTAQQTADDISASGMGGQYFPKLWDWARGGGFANIAHFLATCEIPDEFNPSKLSRAPMTSSFAEACGASIGNVELEIMDAIESCREGFCAGWIGSHELDKLLRERNLERYASRNKRRDMLTALGYTTHPRLPNGRICNPLRGSVPPAKPVLYLKMDHSALSIDAPHAILNAYLDAQRQASIGGLVEVFK